MTARGLNLYGHLSSCVGLGAAARNTARTLDALGAPFDSVNVVPMPSPRQQPMDAALHVIDAGASPRYDINMFHMNPPEIRELLNSPNAARIPLTRFNSAVPFWELSELPASWVECLRTMDAVLAPSMFLRDMVRRDLPGTPVLHFPQGVHLPQRVRADRARWGMPDDATVFVCSFDLRSDMTRKNPLGVIEAFRGAFQGSDAAQLIVRVNHAESTDLSADMELLGRAAGGAVRLLLGPLAYEEVLSLYASADVYVSLHRAEGLGLGMLEAMALGKPVIATAYSGNMDFMDAATGILVGYRLASVKPSPAYDVSVIGESQRWAEPDAEEAVAAMRRLGDDPVLRRHMGESAAAKAVEVNARSSGGAVFDELRELVSRTSRRERRHREIRGLTAAARSAALRRRAVAFLRAVRLKAPAPIGEAPPVYPVVTGLEGLGPDHVTF